jgi:hypothetical protein
MRGLFPLIIPHTYSHVLVRSSLWDVKGTIPPADNLLRERVACAYICLLNHEKYFQSGGTLQTLHFLTR